MPDELTLPVMNSGRFASDCGARCHRLHRCPPGSAPPRRRLAGAGHRPQPGQTGRPAVGGRSPGRDCPRRRAGARQLGTGPAWLPGSLLPGALHESAVCRLRRHRPPRSGEHGDRRRRCRRRADHLSRRPGRRRPATQPSSAFTPRGRRNPAARQRAGDDLPGGDDHRLGERLLRDHALPGRATAGDGHPALDRHPLSADCRQKCPALPGGLPRLPGDGRRRTSISAPKR